MSCKALKNIGAPVVQMDRTVDSGSNASLFDNFRNHGENRVIASQTTLRTILTVAGPVNSCVIWRHRIHEDTASFVVRIH
jgi:hypothetical protein